MRTLLGQIAVVVLLATGVVGLGAKMMPVVASAERPAPTATATPAVERDRTVRLPPAGAQLDYQLGGPSTPDPRVRIVVRDRTAAPAPGRYNVCYVDVFQTQAEDRGWWLEHHPELLLRIDDRLVEDPDWPGQYLLDTSSRTNRVRIAAIMGDLVEGCARSGFDALEPDNLDSWARSYGRITRADNLALATRVVRIAHRAGLAVAQKNAAVLGSAGKRIAGFDFAVAESCQVYRECGRYTRVYGRHVYEVEYTDSPRSVFEAACAARGDRISVVLRDRAVLPAGRAGHRTAFC